MGRLDGKTAVITGGASGIGEGCVRSFVAEGARVVVADLNEERAAALVEELGDSVMFHRTDVANEAHFAGAIDLALTRWQHLDTVINNAGIVLPAAPVQETSDAEFDLLISVNVRGVYLGCKLAYPHLCASKGSVVNIASMAGISGQEDHAVYGATKGAVVALTKCTAVDWGASGVRINAICPCAVRTPAMEAWLEARSDRAEGEALISRLHALGRCAETSEIGAVATFLASEDASFVTGCIMPVSGGSECGYKL